MADYLAASPIESQRITIQRMLDNINVAMPCVVTAVQGGGPPRVTVLPLTQLKVTLGDEVSYKSYPPVEGVPVVLPYAQTAGLALTLPIKAGDTGLLLIPDRGISNFLSGGGEPTPPPFVGNPATASPRAHALADGIFVPGLSVDSAILESYDSEHIELRDKERKNYISLGPDGITMTDGTCVVTVKDGNFKVETSGQVHLTGANIDFGSGGNTIRDTLRSTNGTFIDRDNVNLNSHVHTGVQTGGGNTGEPSK